MSAKSNFKQQFVKMLEQNYDVYSYSGRGMYGSKCPAINFDGSTVSQVAQLATEIANYCYDNHDESLDTFIDIQEEFFDILANGKTDSMGLGSVLYFPSIKWDGQDDEDQDEI